MIHCIDTTENSTCSATIIISMTIRQHSCKRKKNEHPQEDREDNEAFSDYFRNAFAQIYSASGGQCCIIRKNIADGEVRKKAKNAVQAPEWTSKFQIACNCAQPKHGKCRCQGMQMRP
jgi:hypothetical protein